MDPRETDEETGADRFERLTWRLALGPHHARLEAARALASFGEAAVEPLGRALNDRYRPVRMAALRALGETGAPAALEPLCRVLRQGSQVERIAAAEALGSLADPRAIEPLRDALLACFVQRSARRQLFWRRVLFPIWVFGVCGPTVALLLAQVWIVWLALGVQLLPAILMLVVNLKNEDEPQDRARRCAAIATALGRIAERTPTPELRALLPDLRAVSADVLQRKATRAAARTAVRRIEDLTEQLKSLPVPAGAPAPDPASLPLPAQARAADESEAQPRTIQRG